MKIKCIFRSIDMEGMTFTLKNSSLAMFFIVLSLMTGCDILDKFFVENESGASGNNSEVEYATMEKQMLLDILYNQRMLLDDIKNSASMGEREYVKEKYSELLNLDKQFQEQFDAVGKSLSHKDALEISNRHAKFVKEIPPISRLIQ